MRGAALAQRGCRIQAPGLSLAARRLRHSDQRLLRPVARLRPGWPTAQCPATSAAVRRCCRSSLLSRLLGGDPDFNLSAECHLVISRRALTPRYAGRHFVQVAVLDADLRIGEGCADHRQCRARSLPHVGRQQQCSWLARMTVIGARCWSALCVAVRPESGRRLDVGARPRYPRVQQSRDAVLTKLSNCQRRFIVGTAPTLRTGSRARSRRSQAIGR